jgi:hypothetical protein
MASALVGVTGLDIFTESEKNFLFSSFFSIFKHLAIDFYELTVFSVFILIPTIPVVDLGLFLLSDDLELFRNSLVGSKVIVILWIGEEISGHFY